MIRIVLFILTVIFALAAGGKLWLLATDPFADIKLGYSLAVLWLAIAVEFGLVYSNLRAIMPSPRPKIFQLAFSLVGEPGVRSRAVDHVDRSLAARIRFLRLFRRI